MAEENNTFDSYLLCDEETKGLCSDDEAFAPIHQSNGVSDSILFPCLSQECFDLMVVKENEHLPKNDYLKRLRSGELDMSLRKQALDWMFKACGFHNFGEQCLYLAVNYLDRFLSVYNLPDGKTWATQLVAVSCLSLAAKVDEVNVPSAVDLQSGEATTKLVFEGKTIRRMELLVLNCLGWKMRAYTPFNYIDYFIRKINDSDNDSDDLAKGHLNLIARSTQIISTTIKGIDFLEFKASEMSAAVAIYVSKEIQEMDIDKALSCFKGVEKERVIKCLELIQDLVSISGTTTSVLGWSNNTTTNTNMGNASSSSPNSPNGVLEAACLSYGNGGNLHNKRRKLDHHQTTTLGG